MNTDTLQKHILDTYFWLRYGIAIIGFLFPIILSVGGKVVYNIEFQDSMSAYYHKTVNGSSMRDWFVGILFITGAFLYLYKGYSKLEDKILNCAGILAIGIALFPMKWDCGNNCSNFSIHGFCAIFFFLCITYVCICCSHDTLILLQNSNERLFFKRSYAITGGLMTISPIIAFILNLYLKHFVFFVELIGIWAFSAYWFIKSHEISITKSEKLATGGELKLISKGSLCWICRIFKK